ncbi:hypothetical protein EJB05_11331, partial [Eragrostis curvula]
MLAPQCFVSSKETTTNQTKRPPHKPAPIQKTTESWRLAEYTSPTHTRWCDRSTASRPATAATCAGPIKLAGHIGYRCSSCNFDAHEACADYFKQAISFFAHPWHAISLSRIPRSRGGGLTLMTRAPSWACDVCREDCAPGRELRLLLRAQCGFVVHPVCTMLPQVIHSTLHKEHYLHMVPGSGTCSACREGLPVWHYRCGLCAFNLHIACVGGAKSSRGDRIAKYLLKQSFRVAVDAATALRETHSLPGAQGFAESKSSGTGRWHGIGVLGTE